MKIARNFSNRELAGFGSSNVPIPLIRKDLTLKGREKIVYKCRTDPTDDKSAQYEVAIWSFSHGHAEEYLEWRVSLQRIWTGTNTTAIKGKFDIARRCLHGEAKTVFNNAAIKHGETTEDHLTKCLQEVALKPFGTNALNKQRRGMIKVEAFRKPRDTDIQSYVNRLQELNGYLKDFPPFKANQQLSDDQMLNLVEEGVPRSWYNHIIKSFKYDVNNATLQSFVDMCVILEDDEKARKPEADKKGKAKRKNDESENTNAKKQKKTKDKPFKKGNAKKWCQYHETNGHDTSECHVLKKMKSSGDANKPRPNGKKEELKAIVQEQVNRALKSSTAGKKRKEEHKAGSSADDAVDLVEEYFDELEIKSSAKPPSEVSNLSDFASVRSKTSESSSSN